MPPVTATSTKPQPENATDPGKTRREEPSQRVLSASPVRFTVMVATLSPLATPIDTGVEAVTFWARWMVIVRLLGFA